MRSRLIVSLAILGALAGSAPAFARSMTSDTMMESRRHDVLAQEQARPFPNPDVDPRADTYDLAHLNLALADFQLAASSQDFATANGLVHDVLVAMPGQKLFKGMSPRHIPGSPADKDGFHFELAQYLFRIERMYGPTGTVTAGRLADDNRQRVAALFYDWARDQCPIAEPRAMRVWQIWASENHGSQRNSTCWAAAMLLSGMPEYAQKRYADGSLPRDQVAAWNGFLKRYLSEHSTHGTLVEYFSPTYAQYTLQNFYLYADFSADPELKRLATAALDLWWVLWAQEQLGGVHGGSQTRHYARTVAAGSPVIVTPWLYFGLGARPNALGPGESSAVASSYRPPALVADIARDAGGRGNYDVYTRAPGLAVQGGEVAMSPDGDSADTYNLDSQHNAILRVAHVTPGYVLGTAMLKLLPPQAWTPISEQNRWAGLVFAGGDPMARVAPTLFSPNGRHIFDGLFGAQNGGLQLTRSMLGARDKTQGRMQVWFGAPVKTVEAQGWVFADGPAFVAVRPATGGWHWMADKGGRWLVPEDPQSAIILQAAGRQYYADLPAFQAAVGKMAIAVTPDMLRVTGLSSSGTVAMGLGDNGTIQINGRPVNLEPPYVLKSPFVNEAVGDPVVHVQKGGKTLDLDFAIHQ